MTDVSMHFVGPISGSSPCLVLCLETNEGDVLVYEIHRSPEEVLFRRRANENVSVFFFFSIYGEDFNFFLSFF